MTNPFKALLAEMAAGIPTGYLAVVAQHESAFNPRIVNGHAVGLFQITPIALRDYNIRHGTNYTSADLVDPVLNTRIAVAHVQRIIDLYSTIPSLKPDWTSRRWVELLTFGWNAGHSAVARFARSMEAAGIPPERITIDTVHQAAVAAEYRGAVAESKHVRYVRAVVADYLRQGGDQGSVAASDVDAEAPGSRHAKRGGTPIVIFAAAGTLALVGAGILEPATKGWRKS